MKKHLFAMVCMAVSLWSCSNDDAPVVGGPENGKVSAEAQAALFQLYPNATDVNWSVKGEYVVADFNMAATRAAAGEYAAWFDNAGRWYMTTDSEILFDQLPAEVKTALPRERVLRMDRRRGGTDSAQWPGRCLCD